ncbi:MAG TPA: alpha/beta fold hydrolase [Spirochaetota bacterium]|mgnify:CR=1 FL=1|nr:alpha/beta fold hydrolase [Spirochaetota bacterium]HOL57317.1 alpha/beta fold hydrolase [Spirochaetota bacterium]HPP04925.1 alpha/beta fold hydrolase [Spirochaetota bacterium]
MDRELQKRLRINVNLKDKFKFNGSYIDYKIISSQGIIFSDDIDKFHSYGFLKNKGRKIFYQSWILDNKKPFIFFLHGNAENSTTHPAFIYNCIKKGYNFISFDQIGYGDSDGLRGIIKSFDEYIENVDIVFEYFYNKLKENCPIFYFAGFSMGGLELLYYLIFYKKYSNSKKVESIKKGFLFAPYLKNHKRLINSFLEYYFLIFNRCFSYKKLLREDSQKAIFENDDQFYINLYKNLSDNRDFLIRRKKDIRIHRLNSNKWLSIMIKSQREIKNKIFSSKEIDNIKNISLYFFINENDLVVDNTIVVEYCKKLGLMDNLFLQKSFYHDFLDYEDERINYFYKRFFELLEENVG